MWNMAHYSDESIMMLCRHSENVGAHQLDDGGHFRKYLVVCGISWCEDPCSALKQLGICALNTF